MRQLASRLASLALGVAVGTLALAGSPLADEKPQKESKDIQTAKQMHVAFTRSMGVHQDLELQDYVQRVGEKLAAVSEMPDLEWHFTIVDTDDVNAFATLGGYVYISRGILPYFQNEADLAAVLGHEIGHITAEHLKKQNRKGMISGLASVATAIFTGMPALADLTNMAGQAIISGYGRDAELEADRLGASYLARAGYDPEAIIDVISTLKDQDTFERERARLEGREPRLYHGVFASHPDNDTRLKEAVALAGKNASAATGNMSNAEGYLQAIQGLPVGSSARQGMVRENRFYHADFQFTLAFPRDWQIVNQPDKILAIAPRKEHYLEIRTQSPPADLTNPRDFALRGLANKRLARTETLEINGLKAWTGVVRGDPSPYGQATNVRYVVIYYANLMWVFKGASRSGMEAPSGDPFFLSTANTFRRMRGNEFALAEPYRLRVVQAKDDTTMETLAAESSIQKYPLQQLRLINKLYPDGEPKPGDYVKTVK
ncbi:MAG: peptidase M48 Ste24p [Gammaproteobacteria bacterium]|nr:peptidase M48 Ste24p [Gammaproteobacteria bacterium]